MKKIRFIWIALGIGLLCTYLGFKGLGNAYFWDDESLVGITATNLLETGKMAAWDGVNLYSYRNGGMVTDDLRMNTPPLDVWVCALSFKIMGPSVLSGRLPFVLAGLLALMFFFLILEKEFPQQDSLKVYMLVSFAFSTLFLLNIRQCRYNSFAMMSSLGCFYFYLRTLDAKKIWPFAGMALMGVLLFYANSMFCAAFLVSLGMMHLIFHRREYSVFQWKAISLAIAGFLALTVPYALYYKIWIRHDFDFIYADSSLIRKCKLIFWYLRDMNLINALPWMFLVLLGILKGREKTALPHGNKMIQWGFIGTINILMIALISPQPTNNPGYGDVRYLMVSYAFMIGISGYILWLLYRKYPLAGHLLLVIYIFSNIFTLIPFSKQLKLIPYNLNFQWLLPAYLVEIHSEYPTGTPPVAEFLLQNVKPGEMVMSWPEHTVYPLRFITGKRIFYGCGLNQYTHLEPAKIRALDSRLLLEDNYPDWFVSYGLRNDTPSLLEMFQRTHWEGDKEIQYRYRMVKYIDYYWDQTQRPEIYWHHFGPKRDFAPVLEGIYIFQKVSLEEDQTRRTEPERDREASESKAGR